jgi:hypothetical protein
MSILPGAASERIKNMVFIVGVAEKMGTTAFENAVTGGRL